MSQTQKNCDSKNGNKTLKRKLKQAKTEEPNKRLNILATVANNPTAVANNTTAVANNSTAVANNTTAVANNFTAVANNSTGVANNITAVANNSTAEIAKKYFQALPGSPAVPVQRGNKDTCLKLRCPVCPSKPVEQRFPMYPMSASQQTKLYKISGQIACLSPENNILIPKRHPSQQISPAQPSQQFSPAQPSQQISPAQPSQQIVQAQPSQQNAQPQLNGRPVMVRRPVFEPEHVLEPEFAPVPRYPCTRIKWGDGLFRPICGKTPIKMAMCNFQFGCQTDTDKLIRDVKQEISNLKIKIEYTQLNGEGSRTGKTNTLLNIDKAADLLPYALIQYQFPEGVEIPEAERQRIKSHHNHIIMDCFSISRRYADDFFVKYFPDKNNAK